jgi:hypothetical protein
LRVSHFLNFALPVRRGLRMRPRDREIENQRKRGTERQRHTEKYRGSGGHRKAEKERQKNIERGTERQRKIGKMHTEKDTVIQTKIQTNRYTQSGRLTDTYEHTHTQIEIHTRTHTFRHIEIGWAYNRTDRERKRGGEKDNKK